VLEGEIGEGGEGDYLARENRDHDVGPVHGDGIGVYQAIVVKAGIAVDDRGQARLHAFQDRYSRADEGSGEESAADDIEAGEVARKGFEAHVGETEELTVDSDVEAEDALLGEEAHVRIVADDEAVSEAEVIY
jgi:hypothetical protein